jgi:membrane protease YdiL (CAAX protease family)
VSYLSQLGQDVRRIGVHGLDMLVLSITTALALSIANYQVQPFLTRTLGPFLAHTWPAIYPSWQPLIAKLLRGMVIFILPVISLAVLRVPVSQLGMTLGKPRVWLRDIGIAFLVMLPLVYLASRQPAFRRTYPYFPPDLNGMGYFWVGMAARLLYMFAWEFLFRGYLLFGFSRYIGMPAAIAVQTIPFVVMHFGKPGLETYGSIAAAVILGLIAMRAGSFLPCAILHFAVAATLDLAALFLT